MAIKDSRRPGTQLFPDPHTNRRPGDPETLPAVPGTTGLRTHRDPSGLCSHAPGPVTGLWSGSCGSPTDPEEQPVQSFETVSRWRDPSTVTRDIDPPRSLLTSPLERYRQSLRETQIGIDVAKIGVLYCLRALGRTLLISDRPRLLQLEAQTQPISRPLRLKDDPTGSNTRSVVSVDAGELRYIVSRS